MQTLSYVLLFGTIGVATGLVMLWLYTAVRNAHTMDSIFFSLPFG